jgi:branched-chain amino acid transport system substrate-binding protein
MDKAKSFARADVGKALEGLSISRPFGEVTMRAADHQLALPNYLGRVSDKDAFAEIEVVHAFGVVTPAPSGARKL